MARRRPDAIIEAIEHALEFGSLIRYGQSWDFVRDLDEIRETIKPLIASDSTRALTLLEAFITGCYEKSEELDDSSGMFGQLVEGLFCDWIRARQAASCDCDETATKLLEWMTHDDYGYCHRLEEEAVKVLDKQGLKAFANAARAAMATAERDSWRRRQMLGVVKAIHAQARDVEAYAAACDEAGEATPRDCEVLASMCLSRRRPADALAWAERGLRCKGDGRSYGLRLPEIKRTALKRLGRGEEAVNDAWADYCREPAVHTFEALIKLVSKADRAEWRAKALAELDGSSARGLWQRLDLLVKLKERDRLAAAVAGAERAQLVAISHYTTEEVAKLLLKSHPVLAARLQVAMALRVVDAGKAQYYDAALANLEKARNLLQANGGEAEWNDLVKEIVTRHSRKWRRH